MSTTFSGYTFSAQARELARRIVNTKYSGGTRGDVNASTDALAAALSDADSNDAAYTECLAARAARNMADAITHLKAAARIVVDVTEPQQRAEWRAKAPAKWERRNEKAIAQLREAIAAFAAKLASNGQPLNELERAGGAFESAAELKARQLAASFAGLGGVVITAITEEFRRQASQRWSSTSVTSNYANDCYRVALANLLDDLRFSDMQAEPYPEGGLEFNAGTGRYQPRIAATPA